MTDRDGHPFIDKAFNSLEGNEFYETTGQLSADFDNLRHQLRGLGFEQYGDREVLTPQQKNILDIWQVRLRICDNGRLTQSQYRQEGDMQRSVQNI